MFPARCRLQKACFRSDLYRQNLRGAKADLPAALARIEGAMTHATAVAPEQGQIFQGPDAFLDG